MSCDHAHKHHRQPHTCDFLLFRIPPSKLQICKKCRSPKFDFLHESYFEMKPPCSICWSGRFRASWNSALRSRHKNCAPHTKLSDRSPPEEGKQQPVGRPRSLSKTGLRRGLSRGREGAGYLTILREFRSAKIETSRGGVQRAINRKSPLRVI